MTRNPILNAGTAALYIGALVSGIFYAPHLFGDGDQFGIVIPIVMLSLFVLSAAVMGTLFLLHPLLLCFEGNPRGGARLFLQTVGSFAAIVGLLLVPFFFLALNS